jgi:cytochrome c oxidase assembly factor CtaG
MVFRRVVVVVLLLLGGPAVVLLVVLLMLGRGMQVCAKGFGQVQSGWMCTGP